MLSYSGGAATKIHKSPNGDSLKEVINGFEHKWGFPQCAGAVDGTHIAITSLHDFPADYFDHKGWHSIIMQGMVDHLYRLLTVTLDGLEESMTQEFSEIPPSTTRE